MQIRDLGWGFVATLVLSACATQPPATDGASAEPMAQLAAAPAIEAVDKLAANEQPPAQVAGTNGGNDGPPPGWRVIERRGQTVWCSPRPPTGTRLPSKATCMSPEEYQAMKTGGRDFLLEAQHKTFDKPPGG